MSFDLTGLPEELKQYILNALRIRRTALVNSEKEIKEALQKSVSEINKLIGKENFKGLDENLLKEIEEQKIFFSAELDRIVEEGLTRTSYAGLSIGYNIFKHYHSKGLFKFKIIDKDILREAELIAESTMQKKRIYNKKPFVLSERIWDLSNNNFEKIKDIISSGINTDGVNVAKALSKYVKQGVGTLVKDYPNMYERMGGRIPKNLNYEALRLARNELSEVYWQSTIEGYKDNPAIKAIKWLLSNNRIKGFHDICDEMAYADNYGLGAGVYPLEHAPDKPHICCMCNLVPVIARDLTSGDIANKPPENWEEIQERLKHTNSFINLKELSEAERETLREQRRAYYQRRKEQKEAKRKEAERRLESLRSNPVEYSKAYRERYGEGLNANKQNRHIYGHKSVKENASYFKNDLETLQKIVNEKAGTGKAYFERNELVEIIEDARLKGFDFSIVFKKYTFTNSAKIHYSRKGHHIVPYLDYEEDK